MITPYFDTDAGQIFHGNVHTVLQSLPDGSINTCVTSPPYWGLRDYSTESQVWDGDSACNHEWGEEKLRRVIPISDKTGLHNDGRKVQVTEKYRETLDSMVPSPSQGQFCRLCGAWRGSLGLEPTPELYVEHMVEIFREVKRVLRDDGCIWVVIGDSYASGKGSCFNPGGGDDSLDGHAKLKDAGAYKLNRGNKSDLAKSGLKPKDLIGIPWRVAFALQADGWYLRSAMPWVKRSAMPESVKDRPTSTLEYVFLLAKNQNYRFDMGAIQVKASPDSHRRYARGRSEEHKLADGGPGNQTISKGFTHMKGRGITPKTAPAGSGIKANESFHAAVGDLVEYRNYRNTDMFFQSISEPHGMIFCGDEMVGIDVNPMGFRESHFATFPPKLIEPCILAGCPKTTGVVLDPFFGSGTTGLVAYRHDRKFVGIELSEEYCRMAARRIERETRQLKLF